jgi:hypothetical protein
MSSELLQSGEQLIMGMAQLDKPEVQQSRGSSRLRQEV